MPGETALAAALLIAAASGPAAAQDKPQKTQGLEETRLQQFALPAHAAGDYELEGALVEHRGSAVRSLKAGDSWVEDADTIHWLENTGDRPCVVLAVDLLRK